MRVRIVAETRNNAVNAGSDTVSVFAVRGISNKLSRMSLV
jgi:hypothetical protein